MTKDEILMQIRSVFYEVLNRNNIVLTETTAVCDIDGWDSLTNIIVITQIEQRMGIRFNFREMLRVKNLGDLCNAVLTKIG